MPGGRGPLRSQRAGVRADQTLGGHQDEEAHQRGRQRHRQPDRGRGEDRSGDTGGDEADLDEDPRGDPVGVPGGDQGGDRHPARVGGEVDGVLQRCQAVHRLQHVRRGGDVSEGGAHRECEHHQVPAEHARGQDLAGRAEQTSQPAAVASCGREGLRHHERHREEHDRGQAGDHPERDPPVRHREHQCPEQRTDNRCHSGDGGDEVHRPDHPGALGEVHDHGPRNDHRPTAGEPLPETSSHHHRRGRAERAGDGRDDQDGQRSQQGPPTAHSVREGAAGQLAQGHAHEERRQRELDLGG